MSNITMQLKVLTVAVLIIGIQLNFGSSIAQNTTILVTKGDMSTRILYNVDRSVHAIPKSKPNDIYEIQTNGNCINIYPQENCVGQFVRVQTGLNYIYVGNLVGNRLDKNIVVDHEKVIVGSIGPCFEKCDPQNLVGMRKDLSTSVTLHDELYYPGSNYTFSISGMQCIKIPSLTRWLRWTSIRISGTATTTCVELHDDATCGGNSVQLRPGYPYLKWIWWWGLFREENSAFLVRSVSLCGNTCPAVMANFFKNDNHNDAY
ncbi:uncharacterized protein LOC118438021 [Folsomia candida]|uniref:uncharacterized protein LOC118438021 n=1 Tax=Folsomia candida TaxID=158441 RepID=UPI00160525A7|nr:uncharacterized protein LOC118438021 [Folsomia candida]